MNFGNAKLMIHNSYEFRQQSYMKNGQDDIYVKCAFLLILAECFSKVLRLPFYIFLLALPPARFCSAFQIDKRRSSLRNFLCNHS